MPCYYSKTKLKQLNKQFNIPMARKPPPLPVATAVVCDKIAQDVHKRNSLNEIMKMISAEGQFAIPRSMTRAIMLDNDPIGFQLRYRANLTRKPRVVLTSRGINHEGSADGHEKFSSQALQMGPVGFGIYAFCDKASGRVLHGVVVPNARKATTIGHVYLDLASLRGVIFRQLTVDHSSETGDMYAVHIALRKTFAPDLDDTEWPPFVAIKSTSNITIENLWARWLKTDRRNCQTTIIQGRTNGLFNPLDEIDVNLFQWLWPQIVQQKLNEFIQYWNCHRVRSQKTKAMPSGTTPNDIYEDPESYGYEDLGIPVDIRASSRFVDDEFKAAAEEVYAELGSPELALECGWAIFGDMPSRLHNMLDTYSTY
ncbi:hypothetical protein C8Q80DRAFT_1119793 [Daedaleopsis nitida]|nr:hypothetical protein C8Q80DRAFT_1119793 [Daedaleopsis nitida]